MKYPLICGFVFCFALLWIEYNEKARLRNQKFRAVRKGLDKEELQQLKELMEQARQESKMLNIPDV